MMHFSYLFLDIIIGLPALCIFFVLHRKSVLKNKKFILSSLIMVTVIYFIVDPIGVAWQAWGYDTNKILGIYPIGGAVIEELLLAFIDVILVGIVVVVFAEREEKKKPFWPFL